MIATFDHRSHDLVSLPRAGLQEAWMDVTAAAFEIRRDLGRVYIKVTHQGDPLPHLFDADRRLMRLTEHARRHAGEAAGITYIDPNQMPLFGT